jgi:hypothetical protein
VTSHSPPSMQLERSPSGEKAGPCVVSYENTREQWGEYQKIPQLFGSLENRSLTRSQPEFSPSRLSAKGRCTMPNAALAAVRPIQ